MCPHTDHQHSHICDHDHHEHHHDHAGHHHDENSECGGHKHGLWGHHHVHEPASYGSAFFIGILLNSLYIIGEVGYGFFAHSLSLLADAGHNLSDVLGLGAAWLAHYLSQKTPSQNFTYGFKRATILASLSNAIILLLVTGGIIWESIWHFLHPKEVSAHIITIVAFIGILVNGFTAFLFMQGAKKDLNMKGAFLHMLSDAVMALAVSISGLIIFYTNWNIIDPLMSIFVSLGIIAGTWTLLSHSLELALDGVPKDIPLKKVEDDLRALPFVKEIHHLHIWPMSTTETALTVHLQCEEISSQESQKLITQATELLKEKFSIIHPTFQIEYSEFCASSSCESSSKKDPSHQHAHHSHSTCCHS